MTAAAKLAAIARSPITSNAGCLFIWNIVGFRDEFVIEAYGFGPIVSKNHAPILPLEVINERNRSPSSGAVNYAVTNLES
jgi:hypothetical protein